MPASQYLHTATQQQAGQGHVEIPIISAIVDRVGYAFPLAILFVVYLLIRYPDRLIGSHPARPGVHCFPGHPIMGNTLGLIKRGTVNQFENFLEETRKTSLPAISWTFPPNGRTILVNRPEYIEHIQKTNFENYVKGPFFRSAFADLLGHTGIFVADGHVWKTQRKMASHIFSVNQFRTLVQGVVHNELSTVAGLMQGISSNSQSITLPEIFFRYTLSSFSKMAFSADIGCLDKDPKCLQEAVPFAVAFDSAQDHINKRFTRPGWQLWERFTDGGKKMKQWTGVMRSFALDIIKERLREYQQQQKSEKGAASASDKKEKDLLALFMDLTQDEEDLLAVVLNFLIAGRDTTAQALSWLFVELINNPEHVPLIRQEIETVLGSSTASNPHYLDYDQMKDLPYTQACISEAIRLHPPVPKNGKRTLKDDVLLPGNNPDLPPIKVYAKEQVAWSDWVMARTPEVWGPDCEEYKPTRFLEPLNDPNALVKWRYANPGQWKFHAFNGGPRLCLGISLANFEALSFVVSVVPHYDVTQDPNQAWPPTYTNSVTHPCQPYKVQVKLRKEAEL
ncbi:unnamed protein product [Sympodiomycopsis kandeliae]